MAFFFIFSGVILRLIPHLPNFAPIAAIALFGGVYLPFGKNGMYKIYALIIPLVAMLIGDYFIGFYNPWILVSVYGSFLIIGLIGLWLRNHKTILNTISATLFGSILFFIITNFAMWAVPHSFYPHNLSGLISCYTMALPFFRNTLLGDFFYVSVMFSLMEIIIKITKTWELRRTEHGYAFERINRTE
jgi:hypothetical protein